MPISTSIQCPHCGYSAQSIKSISPGAAVRCTRCKFVFRFATSDGGSARSLRAVEAERLEELFAADTDPKTASPSREIDIRVLGDSNNGPPPRSPGPIPVAIKKPILDGKPLPFHVPRTMVAAILLVVSAFAGYVAIRWYVDTVISLDATAATAGVNRRAAVKALADPRSVRDLKAKDALAKTFSAVSPGTVAPGSSAPVATRTVAPQTEQIGHLVVGVFEVQLTNDDGAGGKGHLTVTLRVTNRSAVPTTFVSWSEPTRKVILTDQYRNYYNRIGSDDQTEQLIPPDHTIVDTLQFEKPLPGAVLALDLPIGNQEFQFSVPANFVQRIQVARAAPRVIPAALAQTQSTAPATAPAAAGSEQPYSAERDPQIIADVNAAYKEFMNRVDVRVRGMTSNNGARFRKTEKERMVKVLAEKMEMTVDQIKQMIPSS
jgi:hypothetical protein